eukprot:573519-Hanusia_phi.AAC.1
MPGYVCPPHSLLLLSHLLHPSPRPMSCTLQIPFPPPVPALLLLTRVGHASIVDLSRGGYDFAATTGFNGAEG